MKIILSKGLRKGLIYGAGFLGGATLLTTGFATWVIGINQPSVDKGSNTVVDGTNSSNFELVVNLTESEIIVAEAKDTSRQKGNFVFSASGYSDTNEGADFAISGSATLTVGNNSELYSSTNIVIKPQFNYVGSGSDGTNSRIVDYTDESDATDSNKISSYTGTLWRPGTGSVYSSYEYLGLADPIRISNVDSTGKVIANTTDLPSGVTVSLDESNGSDKVYKISLNNYQLFKWGSYFGGMAPSAFYTRELDVNPTNAEDFDALTSFSDPAYSLYSKVNAWCYQDFAITAASSAMIADEMNAMQTALNGKNIHVAFSAVEG